MTFTALVAAPGGTEGQPWRGSFCTAPKPITEDNVVSSACVLGGDVGDAAALAQRPAREPR